ncbi:HAD-IIIC family phosphatase [Bradyrhizobium septentrionale]|uniref:HAD-IIIC family phosphatase n=1 Tax=Bradyrhizobium septentrionale TaxID=1404411 RepID=UPI001596E0DA|nr:HAD-IIIC family phosphatase [Bradyrhizobium septentrionale]UGY22036.1 HAD-IIIC family phosphatase [Bradyrhizobium septentrionale]
MLTLLSHLPEAPEDFRKRCREATDARSLVRLAGYRLDGTRLEQLARAKSRLEDGMSLDRFRLGVLSNSTTDFLPAAFAATGLRYGLDVDIAVGEYGRLLSEAVDPSSRIYHPPCDAVLLALDHRGFPATLQAGVSHREQVETAVDFLVQTRDAIKAAGPTVVIFQTVSSPPEPVFGNADLVLNGNVRAFVQDLNSALRQLVAQSPGDLLLDVESLANAVGGLNWHAQTQWNLAKLAFAQQALPVYADHVVRLLAAMRGKSKKCLVLDLDNTLWGGAIGDLGVDDIVLGQGSAAGEAFLDVQRMALRLRERGIILAVSSKNNEATALEAFRKHPEMLLKEEHISVFQINWIDKATNLEEIARALDIGVDSLVLLDDNPAERIQVRETLDAVAVPELPDDPSLYPRAMLNAGYFEALSFTSEDSKRADQYRANASRSKLQLVSRDPHEFLKALEMNISFAHFDRISRSRIVQLINKTNQFNLTTRRYTEAEVEAMEGDPDIWTLQVRLADKFGDNGMISVVICRDAGPKTWEIDTWLMSCRVLSRQVEEATMKQVLEHARKAGIDTVMGRYRPTKKNEMVKDFYRRLGFDLVEESDSGTVWRSGTAREYPLDLPMVVLSSLG